MLINETQEYLKEVLNNLGYNVDKVILEESSRKELGDYQINIAFQLAKANHENPREVAQKIIDNLDDRFTNVNIAGPGFINLSFSDQVLKDNLNTCINIRKNLLN